MSVAARQTHPNETVALYKAGLLDEKEIAELTPFWREQYDWSHGPNFFFCGGRGKFLKGNEAHYRWACIPSDIVKWWDRERVQRERTIKKLADGPAC